MQKKVISGNVARSALVDGINQLANTIKATLGPKGRNVVIANEYTGPYITNDGATIAREFILENAFENVGIELVKEVALKTNDLAGDGTTTATILAQKMINEGIRYIDEGYSPMLIKDGIKKASDLAVSYLNHSSQKIVTSTQVRDIAYISSGDEEIGEIIALAIEKIGNDVLISIEESRSSTTKLEIVNGYKIEEGYVSPYMINNQTKMMADFKDPYFLITNEKINELDQISEILEKVIQVNGNLVIISDTIHENVMSTLILNKLQNVLNVVAIQAPSTHERRNEVLEDIAIVTGGKVISKELGYTFDEISLDDLGRASQVQVGKDETMIIGGDANPTQLQQKIDQIKYMIQQSTLDFESDRLTQRVANLAESAAIIKVGALSELEMKEKKMKIEDALCAIRMATKEGVLAGGGVAYLDTAKYLQTIAKDKVDEESIGFEITRIALREPVIQLLHNAGIEDSLPLIKEIEESEAFVGYDIRKSSLVDMFAAGIIDPTSVEIVALQSASSIASLILTTESVLVDATMDSIIKKSLNDQIIKDSEEGLY